MNSRPEKNDKENNELITKAQLDELFRTQISKITYAWQVVEVLGKVGQALLKSNHVSVQYANDLTKNLIDILNDSSCLNEVYKFLKGYLILRNLEVLGIDLENSAAITEFKLSSENGAAADRFEHHAEDANSVARVKLTATDMIAINSLMAGTEGLSLLDKLMMKTLNLAEIVNSAAKQINIAKLITHAAAWIQAGVIETKKIPMLPLYIRKNVTPGLEEKSENKDDMLRVQSVGREVKLSTIMVAVWTKEYQRICHDFRLYEMSRDNDKLPPSFEMAFTHALEKFKECCAFCADVAKINENYKAIKTNLFGWPAPVSELKSAMILTIQEKLAMFQDEKKTLDIRELYLGVKPEIEYQLATIKHSQKLKSVLVALLETYDKYLPKKVSPTPKFGK